jgi:hypothetical protein
MHGLKVFSMAALNITFRSAKNPLEMKCGAPSSRCFGKAGFARRNSLRNVESISGPALLAPAVFAGKTRLIDNRILQSQFIIHY